MTFLLASSNRNCLWVTMTPLDRKPIPGAFFTWLIGNVSSTEIDCFCSDELQGAPTNPRWKKKSYTGSFLSSLQFPGGKYATVSFQFSGIIRIFNIEFNKTVWYWVQRPLIFWNPSDKKGFSYLSGLCSKVGIIIES